MPYSIKHKYYLLNAFSFGACLSLPFHKCSMFFIDVLWISPYLIIFLFRLFVFIILKRCRSWSSGNQHHAWSSFLSFPIGIYCLETPWTFAIAGEWSQFYSWCSAGPTCKFVSPQLFPFSRCKCHLLWGLLTSVTKNFTSFNWTCLNSHAFSS